MGQKMITKSFQHFQLINNTPANLVKGKGTVPGMKAGMGKSFETKMGKSFEAVFGKMLAQKGSSSASLLENKFLDLKAAKGDKENTVIEALLENLQLDGMAPEEVEVDSKGLKIIEQLLEHLGFGEEEVDNFISDLTDGGEKSELSLSGLLTKLSDFLESAKTEDKFSMSAIPAVESLLSSMGVDPSEIETILYNAGSDDGGIDVRKLISGLKSTLAKGTDNSAGGELELNTGNQLILSGLGLSANGKKTLTLEEFIEKLESVVQKKGVVSSEGTPVNELAKSFGEHLQAGAEVKNIHDKQQQKQNSLLDNLPYQKQQKKQDSLVGNHSSQKQQQTFEEGLNAEPEGLKNIDQLKSGQKKFVIRDGSIIVDEHNPQPGMSNKSDDPGASAMKTGVTAGQLASKNTDSVFRLPSDKTLPSYVTNQVSMKIANAAKNGETAFKIQIKPPEMGRLQISLDFTNNGLKVGILAEHTATRDMLLSNSSELKSILADQGIRLDKVQVDVSGDFNQSMADARNESGNSGKKQGKREGSESVFEQVVASESAGFTNETYLRTEAGRLSLVV